MRINSRLKMFDTNYVQVLEECRLSANSIVAELNALNTPNVGAFVDSLTTRQELDQHLLDNPVETSSLQPSGIDITVLNTNELGRNSLLYAKNSKLITRKIPLEEIKCDNTFPVDGYVVATNTVGSKTSTIPSATTLLPGDNLVCVKNGKVIAFPSDPDPEIKKLFLGVNNVHVGISVMFGNPDMIPPGWLLEDGREISKTQYPKLYSVIGDRYGTPSNPSVFRLPDKRGLFIIGHDSTDTTRISRYVGGVSGNNVGSVSDYMSGNTIPSHTHTSISPTIIVDYSKVTTVYRFLQGLTTAYGFVYDTNVGQSSNPETHTPATDVRVSSEYRPKNKTAVSIIRALP